MIIDSGIDIKLLKADGGAALNNYLMQFQSDITGIQIVRAKDLETTALGAAYLAGLAIDYWEDLEELQSLVGVGESFKPEMDEAKKEALYRGWKQAVKATEVFAELTQIDD